MGACCSSTGKAPLAAEAVVLDGQPTATPADGCTAAQANAETITITDFTTCVADHLLETTTASASLAKRYVLFNSLASGTSLRSERTSAGKGLVPETLSPVEWARVTFHVALGDAAASATAATLKFFADPSENGSHRVLVSVNSRVLPAVPVDTRYTGWVHVPVPAGTLIDGDNHVIFMGDTKGEADAEQTATATATCLFIDECYANTPAAIGSGLRTTPSRCAKSFDAGGSWHAGCLGRDGTLRGEYVVALEVAGHPAGCDALLLSPPLDMADPSSTGSAVAPAGFSITSFSAALQVDAPKGTAVVCEVRMGATPSVSARSWTAWQPAASVCSGEAYVESGPVAASLPSSGANAIEYRFAQWRCKLQSASAKLTPTLHAVTLTVQTMHSAERRCEGEGEVRAQGTARRETHGVVEKEPETLPSAVAVAAVDGSGNPPPLARSGLEFTYMAPHPNATRLIDELKLDKVLAEAAQPHSHMHFPGLGADFAQIVGLRTWVHAQWWGWQETMLYRCPSWDALEVLHTVKNNFGFGQCTHFAAVFVGCAAACGFHARSVVLGGAGKRDGGHCLAEAWVPSLGKWVVMDAGPALPYSTHYIDLKGRPLNVVELHSLVGPAPSHPGAKNVLAVKTTKFNSPPTTCALTADPHLASFIPHVCDTFSIPNRNDYTCAPELTYGPGQQGWLGYHYGGLLHYTPPGWPIRDDARFTTSRLADMYPSIGQVRLYAKHAPTPASSALVVSVETTMPNWERYEFQIDTSADWVVVGGGGAAGSASCAADAAIPWPLHAGTNTMAVRAVSRFGVVGPPAELQVDTV